MSETPLLKAVREYISTRPVAFHTPGHKMGKGLPQDFIEKLAEYDVTEILGTDNLHYPEGVILKAQEMVASAFGSDKSYFLVNGSTCGIQASIATVCGPGDSLIVSRDCHRSVFNSLILWRINPIFIKPEFNTEFCIPSIISLKSVEKALIQHPEAKGVLITYPNYYGICSDIAAISDLVHKHGKILIVDEAHGAHLRFSDNLPCSSLDAGADISIQSAHKTLPALTQGAYLHVRSKNINIHKLENYLRMLQTSSPSYLVMCSLDIARSIMQEKGRFLLGKLLETINEFAEMIKTLPNVSLLTQKNLHEGSHDPTRIVIAVGGLGGFDVEKILRTQYNIQVEMADANNIVCIATISDKKDKFARLYYAIKQIACESCHGGIGKLAAYFPEMPPAGLRAWEMCDRPQKKICLSHAEGCVSGDYLTPYPPGIPVVVPGEIITAKVIKYIYEMVRAGAKVNGIEENMIVNIVG